MADYDRVSPIRAADQDGGVAITEGTTAEDVLAADLGRTYVEIQNPSTESEIIYFNFDGTAAADETSRSLLPGEAWWNPPGFCPTGALSVLAATTGHKVVVKYRTGN